MTREELGQPGRSLDLAEGELRVGVDRAGHLLHLGARLGHAFGDATGNVCHGADPTLRRRR